MVEHNDIKQLISLYYDGEATPEEQEIVATHIKECDACKKYLQELDKLSSSLNSWETETLSPDLENKIRNNFLRKKEREGITMKEKSPLVSVSVGLSIMLFVFILVFSIKTLNKSQIALKDESREEVLMQEIQKKPVLRQKSGRRSNVDKKEKVSNKIAYKMKRVIDQVGDRVDIPKTQVDKKIALLKSEEAAKEKLSLGTYSHKSQPYYLDNDYTIVRNEEDLKTKQTGFYSYDTETQINASIMDASAPYWGDANQVPTSVETKQRLSESKPLYKSDHLTSRTRGAKVITSPSPGKKIYRSKRKGNIPNQDIGGLVTADGYYEGNIQVFGYDGGKVSEPQDQRFWFPIEEKEELEGEEFYTEDYDRIYENDFLESKENPLSTFSIDVDTASYSNLRRYLNSGQRPPKDAVRIEEMINYFVYDYPQPQEEDPFSVTIEVNECPWNTDHDLALVGLQGKELSSEEMVPSNLVFLIDVSGSMDDPKKLPLLKSAFRMLVEQLREEERIAIVTYAGSAGLVLDSTSGYNREKIIRAIENLEAGGSTAGGSGIKLAYKIARQNFISNGNNRVILATDGDFNIGISSDGHLVRLIEENRDDGVFLSVLGFGTGNYKDSKMEKLADKGNGNYYYIDTLREAKKVLVQELGSMLFTIAKDVKLQIEFNPSKVKAYRLIGYENRVLAKEDFNDDNKDAGELGAGHTVTALYEIVPVGSKEEFAKVDQLKYQQTIIQESDDLMTVKFRYKHPKETKSKLITHSVMMEDISKEYASDNFMFASSVAELGLLLRDSQYKANASYLRVLDRARKSMGNDYWGYREEFISLVEKAGLLENKER